MQVSRFFRLHQQSNFFNDLILCQILHSDGKVQRMIGRKLDVILIFLNDVYAVFNCKNIENCLKPWSDLLRC